MTDPLLLTPGPLTTHPQTRAAMLRDWGSWDGEFNALTARVCARLLEIPEGANTHVCVPLQGSGTFAVEAALGTLVPPTGKVLVPDNGAYCRRILSILATLGRAAQALPFAEDQAVDPGAVDRCLAAHPEITHVALVHCETGTGIENPLHAIAQVVAARGRGLIVDAMSSFGALPIHLPDTPIDALVSASGKCLEGVPGMGFVLARRDVLADCAGRCHSLALDLHAQWRYLEETGQWRFTPPTHVVAALDAALTRYGEEGGQAARLARYRENSATLSRGMAELGFVPFLPATVQAPIIHTFHAPADPAYHFPDFYQGVRTRGYVLYPGKLTRVPTFRVGCIGALTPADLDGAVAAIRATLVELGVRHCRPEAGA